MVDLDILGLNLDIWGHGVRELTRVSMHICMAMGSRTDGVLEMKRKQTRK